MAPIAFGAAGAADPQATGRNIARVAAIGLVIGWLAQATSLRLALGITALLALVIAAAARVVQKQARATSLGVAVFEPA